jgi:acetylglutamate kinase
VTRVVKLGGRTQADPTLAATLAALWNAAPGTLCVVHGGGDEISALQRKLGGAPIFVGGRRVTTREDIEIIRMVLSGSINKRLVADLVGCGIPAVGLSGEDAGFIEASPLAGALGAVGTPHHVDARIITHLLAGGFLPIVSPLSRNADAASATALNVNGDDAAAALAVALRASELLLLADVPGVISDDEVLASIDVEDAAQLIARGTAAGGMAAKLEAALGAVAGGVARVRIGDLSALADPDAGTSITLSRSYA